MKFQILQFILKLILLGILIPLLKVQDEERSKTRGFSENFSIVNIV